MKRSEMLTIIKDNCYGPTSKPSEMAENILKVIEASGLLFPSIARVTFKDLKDLQLTQQWEPESDT